MTQFATALAMLCLGLFAAAGAARARDELTVLHQFDNSGNMPASGLTFWRGQIFGATNAGGSGKCTNGCGTIYRLSPSASGHSWTFETLYSFQGGADGGAPYVQLTIAPDGDVYGYTSSFSQGAIFRLLPPAQRGQAWTFQTLYTFQNGKDGNLNSVSSPLILHGSHLYGVASGGSTACTYPGCGSVFRLDPPAPGQSAWHLVTVYAFNGADERGAPNDIAGPDASGAFYVSTSYGKGAVFRLAPPPGRANNWAGGVIASFPASRYGTRSPYNLLLAASGTIYGLDDAHGGDVFSLTPTGRAGRWTLAEIARLYSYGYYAPSSLAFGPGDSLIGVTYGDQDIYFGNAFQISPPAGGSGPWTTRLLWDFNRGPDQNPNNIVRGYGGELLGVLSGGGYQNGTVFELTP